MSFNFKEAAPLLLHLLLNCQFLLSLALKTVFELLILSHSQLLLSLLALHFLVPLGAEPLHSLNLFLLKLFGLVHLRYVIALRIVDLMLDLLIVF